MWLADAGYGLKPGFLMQYRTVRYHLREQALARQRPQTKEELFNLRHAQLRNVIERILGVVKERFRILSTPMEFDFKTQTRPVRTSFGATFTTTVATSFQMWILNPLSERLPARQSLTNSFTRTVVISADHCTAAARGFLLAR
jgi:hypothetical protein